MSSMSEQFENAVKNIKSEKIPSESYIGVLLYTYRRRRNQSRKELEDEWGLDEEKLLRIECGYASGVEACFILSKICTKNK